MGTALLKRRDDFGKLAASLESMRNEMSGLIGEITTSFEYDGIQRLVRVTDTEDNVMTSTYDMGEI